MRYLVFILLATTLIAQHSAGPAPAHPQNISTEAPRGGLADVDMVGAETQTGFFQTFTSLNPETMTQSCTIPDIGNFPGGGDIGPDDNVFYMGNNAGDVYAMDLTTCVSTLVGNATLSGGETFSGFAYNPLSGIMYASGTNITQSSLYTIDLNTGAATLIGPMTATPCAIALACDSSGQLYTYDICDDNFYAVSNSGVATLIGSIGFNANFGQGLSYDFVNDVMYMAAFNGDSFAAELRTVDLGTGATTFAGNMGTTTPGGLLQVASLGVQSRQVPIPTMSEWGLIIMVSLLAIGAIVFSRRRRVV